MGDTNSVSPAPAQRECWLIVDCEGRPSREPPFVDDPPHPSPAVRALTAEQKARNTAGYMNRRGKVGSPFRLLRVRYPWPLPGAAPAPTPTPPAASGPPYDWGDEELRR